MPAAPPPPTQPPPVAFRVQPGKGARSVSRAIDPGRVGLWVCATGELSRDRSAPLGPRRRAHPPAHPPTAISPSCDLFRSLPGPRIVLPGIPAFSRGQFGLRIFYPTDDRFSIDRKPNHQLLIPVVFSSPSYVQPQHAHVKF